MFHADLHIHSKFSRACSKDCDIPHLAAGALRKGISVVGTGDFTHPAWTDELKGRLVPAEEGLLRLRPDLEKEVLRRVPASCGQPVRFMLSVEISTIYRRDERTRKVHHLIYAPTFEAAGRITASLSKIGNLASDGRPILGLDSRDLLEITLEGGPGCYLVPAHIWTPWFAVLGSRSGFDAVADCYGDLAGEIFAVETGLSSDPAMNWMCSSLDAYRLVSNSDAHSPPMLGREATTFTAGMDYFSITEALRTGDGLAGTIEFYPEEGKYHLDGHRKCGVRLDPRQTRELEGPAPSVISHSRWACCTGSPNSPTGLMATGQTAWPASITSFSYLKSLARSSRSGRRARALTVSLTGSSRASGRNLRSCGKPRPTTWPALADRRSARRSPGSAAARCGGSRLRR